MDKDLTKECDVEKFLTSIRKARDLEDRIIYRLNDAVRTKSMTNKKFNTANSDGGCESLKQELDSGRQQREQKIRECLASHEVAMTSYKAGLDNGEDGFRRSVFKGMRLDRQLLISDQNTEYNTRARVDKLFDEKCN